MFCGMQGIVKQRGVDPGLQAINAVVYLSSLCPPGAASIGIISPVNCLFGGNVVGLRGPVYFQQRSVYGFGCLNNRR
jgi:hypothetical protein